MRHRTFRSWTAPRLPWLLALALAATPPVLRGQEGDPAKADDREGRLAEMKAIAESFAASKGDDADRRPLALRRAPLHRWNDPTRTFSDGSFWAWGTGRPAAIVAIELYPPQAGTPGDVWSLEFVSLSTGPLEVRGGEGFDRHWDDLARPEPGGRIRWAPSRAGVEFRPIPGAPTPGRSPAVRLAQMKDLLRRFSAHEFYDPGDQRIELRPMPRPIDRYADPASGILDGAIFLFANGTNPEVMVLIEARGQEPADASWHHAEARLSRARSAVALDGKEVWSRPFATRPAPDEPYFLARKMRRR